jgi:hypothetical protein
MHLYYFLSKMFFVLVSSFLKDCSIIIVIYDSKLLPWWVTKKTKQFYALIED